MIGSPGSNVMVSCEIIFTRPFLSVWAYAQCRRARTHTHLKCSLQLSLITVLSLSYSTKGHQLSPSAEPLTNKHLGAIAQIVTDWKELGLQLEISSEYLDHIARTHRTNSERCSKMLQHWLANVEQRSEPRVLLAETLLNLE